MCPSLTATFRRTRICVLTSTLTAATPAYPKNTDIPTSPTAKNPCKTRMTFEQKSSPRQRQHAPLRIAESLARFIALLTAQRICAISSSRDKNSRRSFAKLSAWWVRTMCASGKIEYSATQTKFGYHRAKMHDIITKRYHRLWRYHCFANADSENT